MSQQISRARGRRLYCLHWRHTVLHHERELFGAGAVGTNAQIGSKRHLYTRPNHFAKGLVVPFGYLAIMLQEVRRDGSLLALLLYALFIVKVHVEVSALLLRECDSLVVDQRCMLN